MKFLIVFLSIALAIVLSYVGGAVYYFLKEYFKLLNQVDTEETGK